MPITEHGNRGATCADCYFRQELLCALQTNSVCPTFRATVGRGIARPRQAILVPLPMVQRDADVLRDVPPAIQMRDSIRAQGSARHARELAETPFSSAAAESTFTIRDAEATSLDEAVVPARDVADPRPVLRSVASQRARSAEIVVPLDDEVTDSDRGSSVAVRDGGDDSRASRIARRIAQRYPNALQPC